MNAMVYISNNIDKWRIQPCWESDRKPYIHRSPVSAALHYGDIPFFSATRSLSYLSCQALESLIRQSPSEPTVSGLVVKDIQVRVER
jgi:hypothetical protein